MMVRTSNLLRHRYLSICLGLLLCVGLTASEGAQAVGVTVGTGSGQPGETVQVAVSLANVPTGADTGIVGMEFTITYDPDVIRAPMTLDGTDPVTNCAQKITSTVDWSLEQNALLSNPADVASQTGTLEIAMAYQEPLLGDGDILQLSWEVVGSAGGSSDITVAEVHLYPSTGEQDEHTPDPIVDGQVDVLDSGGPSITFTFAHGRITGTTPRYCEFDVMAHGSEEGTRLGDTQVYLNYSTAGFGQSVVANGKATVTQGTLLQGEQLGAPLYEISNVTDNTVSRMAITTGFTFGAPTAANVLPATATQLLHVKLEIDDATERGGFSFQSDLMGDQQYQSDNSTKYAPVIATDTYNPLLTPEVLIKIRLWLEGAYQGAEDRMTTTLNTEGSLPLTSPYSQAARSVGSIPAAVTDWVLVQLRDTSTNTVASESFFLRQDGYLVDTDGSTMDLTIPSVSAGDYYLVVQHRNHLAIMTAAPQSLGSGNVVSIDFTTGTDKYYGNSAQELEAGVFGMFAGDANKNGQIQNDDKNDYWKVQVGTAGYQSADFNLNGQVQNDDKNDYWKTNVGLGTQVP